MTLIWAFGNTQTLQAHSLGSCHHLMSPRRCFLPAVHRFIFKFLRRIAVHWVFFLHCSGSFHLHTNVVWQGELINVGLKVIANDAVAYTELN